MSLNLQYNCFNLESTENHNQEDEDFSYYLVGNKPSFEAFALNLQSFGQNSGELSGLNLHDDANQSLKKLTSFELDTSEMINPDLFL